MSLNKLWRQISHTKALDEASGDVELEFFDYSYRLAYMIGASAIDKTFGYRLYSSIMKISVITFIGCEIWYLLSEASSLDDVINNINVTLLHMIAIFRYKNINDNKSVFTKLSSSTVSRNFDVSTKGRAGLLQHWVHRNKTYFTLLFGLGTCTLFIWYVYPLVDNLEYNLPMSIRLPVDHRTPLNYPAAYVLVAICFHYVGNIVMYNDLLMQAHLVHLTCQFSVLADCFENIIADCHDGTEGKFGFNEQFRVKYLKRLENLVDQHKFVLECAMDIRNVLSFPLFCQLGGSCLLICFAGYQVSATLTVNLTKFLLSLLFLCCNMFESFIFCTWCDEINVQSERICQAVYFSGWECGLSQLPGVKCRLMLVMLRASKPIVLTAGGLYDLSLASYTTLVKTSYSALTVLLQLRHN